MAKVAALEEHVIRQIAAGEVVERPASVVKELFENSIDAGAARITLETEGSGRELIRIADDGCGMSPGDAELSLERHTTSKIHGIQDLETLHTFGFRGEALPSIASVSEMELVTRDEDSSVGALLLLSGGKIIEKSERGRSLGTTITVRNLFFNQPARLKFMKAESTERSKILQTFEEAAFAHPHIFFEYRSRNLELPARQKFVDRIADVWGKGFNGGTLFPISFQHPFLKIDGWVSRPQSHQATRNYQIFYVNRRPIQSRLVSHALYEAFRDCLPVGRHPAALIFLSVDPSQVDVNVHPSKREVRFRNERQIHEAIVGEIRSKRTELSGSPKIFAAGTPAELRIETADSPMAALFNRPGSPNAAAAPQPAAERQWSAPQAVQNLTAVAEPLRVLSQFNALYIIAEQNDSLVIVDQHAAAERVLYEKFRSALLEKKEVEVQPLLIPMLWNVSLSQAEILSGHLEAFNQMGFRIERFGETTFRVTEIPCLADESQVREALDNALSALENEKDPLISTEDAIAHAACRAAIKANDRLNARELSELLNQLAATSNPHTCPHGRPVALTLTRAELDKKFGRT